MIRASPVPCGAGQSVRADADSILRWFGRDRADASRVRVLRLAGPFLHPCSRPASARQTRVAGARARLAFRTRPQSAVESVATSCRKGHYSVTLSSAELGLRYSLSTFACMTSPACLLFGSFRARALRGL